MAVSTWLAATVVLSIVIALLPQQNFDSYFLVFGKCGVIRHRLYRDSVILSVFFGRRSSLSFF